MYVNDKKKNYIPESSGKILRSYGMVGSMNGVGVLVSLNMGKLIATLEPRRRRMLAVSVLFEGEYQLKT